MPNPFIPHLAQTRVVKFARIRRERVLPARGHVLVQVGNRVGALDIVARAETIGHVRAVPLARYLRTNEKEVTKYLLKKPGDAIEAREIIAAKPEFFGTLRRIYRAPSNGRLTSLRGAWLALDLLDAPFELKALYRGSIVNVMPRSGVVIEATGALAQGVWGGGGEGYGVLKKMVESPDQVLTEDTIDLSARGVVILAGAGVTEETLRRAAKEQAAGLIVGGLQPRLREVVHELRLPTIVTEGWGERSMCTPIFELLSSHNGDETIITTGGKARAEVFIPILAPSGAESAMPPPTLVAEIGATVRIIAGAHAGTIGTIVDIPTAPRTLPSGTLTWGAEIETADQTRVVMPWENLELIG